MQTIIRKIHNGLGVEKSRLVIGDLRQEMGRDLMRKIESIVNAKGNLDHYYILIHCRSHLTPFENTTIKKIQTQCVIMTDRPPQQLGTICIYVNNRKGDAEILWVLPRDIPIPDQLVSDGSPIERVAKDAAGMPIIH